jgi:hypothetical protein
MGIVGIKKFEYREVPKELILLVKDKFEFNVFFESGTYLGQTALWASLYFEKVITVEANIDLYRKNIFKSNIEYLFGDSCQEISKHIRENTIFYLDAHYSGENTFFSYPLIQELKEINNSQKKNIFIIVDDARFCLSKWNDESYGSLSEIVSLLSNKEERYVVCFDDMFIAAPHSMKLAIDSYTNEKSKEYWNSFLQGTIMKNPLINFFKLIYQSFKALKKASIDV